MQDADRASSIQIVVRKAAKLLEIWQGGGLAASMPVALGFAPTGHKLRSGDGRTPEGLYRVCVRNEKSKYHLSVGLSYPNADDAVRGLAGGLITREQHDLIVAAASAGRRPPWDTALGGEIFVHGGGIASDWTAGCVALNDGDMDRVWQVAALGTEVWILP